jgi:BatD DUF11 like domain
MAFLPLLWLPVIAGAQGSVVFEAYADAKEVVVNGYFDVSFTLKNANGTHFNPPGFKDFMVLAGPNTSTSMQFINGQVSKELSYSFTLQPTKPGQFTIGNASISVNGKRLNTRPIRISVVKSKPGGSLGKAPGEVFVRLEPSKTSAYAGEQILLDYKLYTTASIEGYDIPEEPAYLGFYAMELTRYNAHSQQEVIDGTQYTTKVLRRVALFPQQTGTLTIEPFTMQFRVVEDGEGRGFFFNRKVRPVIFTTDPVQISVTALPVGAPDYFSGAVGSYEFQASVNPANVTTNDAISVVLLMAGNGDLKRVQAPDLMLSDSFEVYPPKVLEEKMTENQGEVQGKKVVEYLVLPKYPGQFQLQPGFAYFDPRKSDYVVLRQGPFPIHVKQGSGNHHAVDRSRDLTALENDIRFIKTQFDIEKKEAPFAGSLLFWAMMFSPVLVFMGILFYRKARDKSEGLDATEAKRRRAGKEARKRLALARKHLQAGDSRAFYDEVSKASLGYVCDKLNIPRSELTKENVREKLHSLRIEASQIEAFMKMLQTCEMALFAGMDNSTAMQSTYDNAISVIAGIESKAGQSEAAFREKTDTMP